MATATSMAITQRIPCPRDGARRPGLMAALRGALGCSAGRCAGLLIVLYLALAPLLGFVTLGGLAGAGRAEMISTWFQLLAVLFALWALARFGRQRLVLDAVTRHVGTIESGGAWDEAPLDGVVSAVVDALLSGKSAQDGAPLGLDALQRAFETSIESLERCGQAAMRLGILGTFFGFGIAMPELSALMDAKAMTGGTGLFTSLQTCFSTSIAGLISSFAVGIVAADLRDGVTSLLARLGLRLSARATGARGVPSRREMWEFSRALRQVADRIATQNSRLDTQTSVIGAGIDVLATQRMRIDELCDDLDRVSRATAQVIHGLGDALDPDRIGQAMGTAIERAVAGFEATVGPSATAAALGVDRSAKALEQVRASLRLVVVDMEERRERRERTERAAGSLRAVADRLESALSHEGEIVRSLGALQAEVCRSIESTRGEPSERPLAVTAVDVRGGGR